MSDFWSIYIVNVNLLVSNEDDDEVKMYTYFPFAPTHCEQAMPIVINQYVNRRFAHPVEFPDKFRNMHGCRVIVAPLNAEPFVIFGNTKNGSFLLHGLEIAVLNAMASKLNFTVDIHLIQKQSVYTKMDEVAFEMVRIKCVLHLFAQ